MRRPVFILHARCARSPCRRNARRTPPSALVGLGPVHAEQAVRGLARQRLDLLELAVHHARALFGRLDRARDRLELRFRAREHVAELAEFGLHRAEHLPDLARALLDRERAEPHLQTVQQRRQRRRAGHRHAIVALQQIGQAGAAQDLRVEPFGRQEQQRKIGRVRRRDVLFGDRARLRANPRLERARGLLDSRRVRAFLRVDQAFVVFTREFRVDRQPHRFRAARRAFVVPPRQPDRELDALAALRHRRDVLRVLIRRQHLLEQRLELHLTPGAARLHVRQHLLQVADARRERLHLAEPAVHLLEPVRHELERFAEALLERRVQLLVDGAAHLFELRRIVRLDFLQARLERRAHLADPAIVRLRQLRELLVERIAEMPERRALLFARELRLPLQRVAHRVELLRVARDELRELLREAVDLIVLHRRDARELCGKRLLQLREVARELGARMARAVDDLRAQLALEALGRMRVRVVRVVDLLGEPLEATAARAAAQQHDERDDERHRERDDRGQQQGFGHMRAFPSTPGLIGFGGRPARGPAPSAAIRLSAARFAIARRVPSLALAMCGVSTTFGTSSSAGCTLGSPSNTSRPAAAIRFSRSASASAASSTIPPRAMFVSVALGFISASSAAPIV
ncbi:hypothetical protein BURPS1710b_2925 [Burkholderia pseudomallei 1710b]|uniref:Uncharacterized protein n=1 Tax=Burkholderia pseudomallei (strain 1710b) TaxID=320372 RepID=Q3JQ48_BURP1|nr:hypothetical protein BURPS1710b_2925 [Burkholderia pseudomallei 1710b]